MNQFVTSITGTLQQFPAWGVALFCFLSACIQQIFPPYPSEVLLLALGALTGRGVLWGPAAIVPYAAGTVVSSLALFWLSRRLGHAVLANRYVLRVFPRRSQRHAAVYVRRYGPAALALCKFLPGVNTVCIVVGGAMGLSGPAPALAIVLAGIVENAVYFIAGCVIGDNAAALGAFAHRFTVAAVAFAAALVVLYILFRLRKPIRKWLRRRRAGRGG